MKKLFSILIFLAILTACAPSEGQLVEQGNQAFDKQDYQAAGQAYKQAQDKAPTLAEPYYNAANTAYRQKNYTNTEVLAKQSLQRATGALAENTYYNLGNSFFDKQDYKAAADAYEQALWLDPQDKSAKHNLELALQKLKEQQQQSQQNQQDKQNQDKQDEQKQDDQNKQDKQDQQKQDDQNQQDKQNQTPQPTATSAPSSSNSDKQDKQTPTPQSQPNQVQAVPLTPEQARQLLESAARDSKTLQEYLQQLQQPPQNGKTGNDW